MSTADRGGDSNPGARIEVPPEVPEEFAAAYRDAYERALAAQSPHPHRRHHVDQDDPDALPERGEDALVGTHREDDGSTWLGIRSAPWFVPALLLVIALLMILVAYALGVAFADYLNATS